MKRKAIVILEDYVLKNLIEHCESDPEKECGGFDKNILYAGCFLVSIPPLLLFVFFNKLFTSNVSLGGIKE